MAAPETLATVATPALVVDRGVLDANLRRMDVRADTLGVKLRPHLKTSKSIDVARRLPSVSGICVSTLEEAAYFWAGGFPDICCPNVVDPAKVDGFAALAREGARITLCVADPSTARFLVERAITLEADLAVLVEIESGAERTGVTPDSPQLPEIASIIALGPRTTLAGVMTYAGQAYASRTASELRQVAEIERGVVVRAAERLRAMSLPCPTVSVGSTPSSTHASDLTGVTEIRPGNYMFSDCMQVALGSTSASQIALSVLATVLFSDAVARRVVVDAGALALSKDGANGSFGAVVDLDGSAFTQPLRITQLYQEHGVISGVPPSLVRLMPVGGKVRIRPYHACLTAAPYDRYHIVDGSTVVVDRWTKLTGTYQ